MALPGKAAYLGYQLTEAQLRYAMANTTSNAEAAVWLHVSFATWKKYAKMYIDQETGKPLYDLHRDEGAAKRLILPKTKYKRRAMGPHTFQPFNMEDVFANKHPKYSQRTFKNRLINEGWLEERCSCCGYQERRAYDYEVPLKLHWIDGNEENYALTNVQLLCFNCFFVHVGNPWGGERKFMLDEATGEPIPVYPRRAPAKGVQVGPFFQKKENTIE